MLRPGLAHVRELLQSNRLIRRHLEHRDRELALLGIVLGRLPDPLRAHCRDAALTEGVLTLFLDSPAWATRARFLVEDLTRSLGREGVVKVATQVRVRDEPRAEPRDDRRGGAQSRPHPGTRLTDGAIAHILGAAEGMPDPLLADIFRRFAQHHTPTAGAESDDAPGIRRVGEASRPKSD
jgi:hypothetical protein